MLRLATALSVLGLATIPIPSLGGSGLRGIVVRAPTAPACVKSALCSAPAKNTTLVFTNRSRVVRTQTDAKGRYRVGLAPGWWRVRTARAGVGSGIHPQRVQVAAARFRLVDFSIDTGIR
jgi:hypothetical protein